VAVLLGRPTHEFKIIEDIINGVMDSLILADITMFRDVATATVVKTIIRQILKIGTYNRGFLVKEWKEFINFFFHKWADTKTLEPPKMSEKSIFGPLMTRLERYWKFQKPFLKEHVHFIKHMCSSRQMP
jgi:hypothetical protein